MQSNQNSNPQKSGWTMLPDGEAKTENNLGIEDFSQNKLESALAHFDKAIELNPFNFNAYNNRAGVHLLLNQNPLQAFSDMLKALDCKYAFSDFDTTDVINRIEVTSTISNMPFVLFIGDTDRDTAHHLVHCITLLNITQPDVRNLVLEDHSKAIESKTEDQFCYSHRAKANEIGKQWDQAIADYSKAIELARTKDGFDKRHIIVFLTNKARMLRFINKHELAINDMNAAIELALQIDLVDAQIASLYVKKAVLHKLQNNISQALRAISIAIGFYDKNAALFSMRADLRKEVKQFDEAILDFTQAIKLCSGNKTKASYHNKRGLMYSQQNKLDEALQDYNAAMVLDENNAVFHNNLGNCYNNKGNYDLAIPIFSKALEIDAKDANYAYAYLGRGYAYASMKNYVQAIKDFDSALQLDPSFETARLNRLKTLAWLVTEPTESTLELLLDKNRWSLFPADLINRSAAVKKVIEVIMNAKESIRNNAFCQALLPATFLGQVFANPSHRLNVLCAWNNTLEKNTIEFSLSEATITELKNHPKLLIQLELFPFISQQLVSSKVIASESKVSEAKAELVSQSEKPSLAGMFSAQSAAPSSKPVESIVATASGSELKDGSTITVNFHS